VVSLAQDDQESSRESLKGDKSPQVSCSGGCSGGCGAQVTQASRLNRG
jgi:hypothetical protein